MDTLFIIIQKKNIETIRRWQTFITITEKKIAYNFRENDINNNGNGAPLAPIYHSAIAKKLKK